MELHADSISCLFPCMCLNNPAWSNCLFVYIKVKQSISAWRSPNFQPEYESKSACMKCIMCEVHFVSNQSMILRIEA